MSEMARRSQPGTCPDCGGPSRTHKGTHHKWRCVSCVQAAIEMHEPPRSTTNTTYQEATP